MTSSGYRIMYEKSRIIKIWQAITRIEKKRAISQGQLSKIAGLHRTYISGIERGIRNPALKNIQKLAHALEISPKEFFNNGKN